METAKNTDKAIVVHLGFGPELPGASRLLRLMLASFLQDRCHGSSGCSIFFEVVFFLSFFRCGIGCGVQECVYVYSCVWTHR